MKHVLFFDQKCPLCQHSVRAVLSRDRRKIFCFAPLGGATAKRVGIETENTLVLLENYTTSCQKIWVRGRGFFRILWLLGGWRRLIGWLYLCPIGLDLGYRLLAHQRHCLGLKGDPHLLAKYPDRFLP